VDRVYPVLKLYKLVRLDQIAVPVVQSVADVEDVARSEFINIIIARQHYVAAVSKVLAFLPVLVILVSQIQSFAVEGPPFQRGVPDHLGMKISVRDSDPRCECMEREGARGQGEMSR
jgi:hypothetical protein